ncbi:MAG: hypothetical protein IJZ23_09380 [Roseburia sp.]|nr:hypothetical protein [Roseburia sp.]
MKKKTKLLLVVLCLSVFALMALGSGSSDSDEKKDVVTSDSTEKNDMTVETESESVEGITIEEQILFEQDGIVVTAKEYVTDDIWGDGIKLLVENNSEKTVTVGCNALIVNNYMITDLFVSEIAAGKKANEVMYLSNSELNAAGIESVGQVEIYFHVYDSESWETLFNTECITIQTSEFANMDTTPDDAGTELYNADGIRIVGKTVDENSFWGTAILLYCENNSGKNVGISVEEMSINGFMMNPFYSTTVYDGKMSIDEITIFSSDLEENGIETIEEVELKFHIYDADSYSTITDSEAITFSAQ